MFEIGSYLTEADLRVIALKCHVMYRPKPTANCVMKALLQKVGHIHAYILRTVKKWHLHSTVGRREWKLLGRCR